MFKNAWTMTCYYLTLIRQSKHLRDGYIFVNIVTKPFNFPHDVAKDGLFLSAGWPSHRRCYAIKCLPLWIAIDSLLAERSLSAEFAKRTSEPSDSAQLTAGIMPFVSVFQVNLFQTCYSILEYIEFNRTEREETSGTDVDWSSGDVCELRMSPRKLI